MKEEIYVTKRDGTRVLFDVSKIKKSIQLATDGQDVNPLELESKYDQFLKNGIKTNDIQLNVIQHASQLATVESPDWTKVAGRAFAMNEWANFPLRGKSFKEVVHFNVKRGSYTKDLLDFYTDDEIDELGAILKMNRDLEHSYASLITAKNKYLGKYELNQHMHLVNAMRFGQLEPKETRLRFVKDVYNALSLRKISLATPFLSNLRKGGNIASCFILAIEDDLDSIFDNVKRIGRISKNGGGIGIFLGLLRAKGSTVNGHENAAGPVVQWIKIINDTLVAVNQSFTYETIVLTLNGEKKISEITLDDLILTHDGTYKEVEKIYSNENNNNILEIETIGGKVNITEGHPVMVINGNTTGLTESEIISYIESGKLQWKWKDACELEPDDYIISIDQDSI
jgi:hypothetical protein